MYVIEVMPLQKGSALGQLSYFSKDDYPVGTLLTIPIRNRQLKAMVVKTESVSATKTALRSATFSLRKLPEQATAVTLTSTLRETATTLADRYPAPPGAILFSLLPADIRDGTFLYPTTATNKQQQDTTPHLLTAPRQNRHVSYRNCIRTAFAHRGSVLCVVPTTVDVEQAVSALGHGIETRIVTFHSQQSKTTRAAMYEAFSDVSIAKLIIVTPSFAFLERCDLTHIIIDDIGSQHFIDRTRPYLNRIEALTCFAKIAGRSLILGDILPPTHYEAKRRDETYASVEHEPLRHDLNARLSVIDQRQPPGAPYVFSILSDELTRVIRYTLEGKQNVFLYAARQGLATLVICQECGFVFRCPDSGTPFRLVRTGSGESEVRWFVSPTSGKKCRAADVCEQCGGWRLKERGIGIEQIKDACRAAFPHTELFTCDAASVKTHAQAKRLFDRFAAEKGALLIGTAMAIPYLPDSIALSAIVSYDAARAIPSWRADELTLRFLLELRDKTAKQLVIQTRSEPDELLAHATKATIAQFYSEEIELRQELRYPPAATLVLLSYTGTKTQVQALEQKLAEQLAPYAPSDYADPTAPAAAPLRHTLLRLDANAWPNLTLRTILTGLPPSVKIEINPDRIV